MTSLPVLVIVAGVGALLGLLLEPVAPTSAPDLVIVFAPPAPPPEVL